MTTYVDFTPSNYQPFQFQAELDGETYTVLVTWNLFGQRYYLNITSLAGTQVATIPMIGSPNGRDINLVGPYFTTSTLIYRAKSNQFEISP